MREKERARAGNAVGSTQRKRQSQQKAASAGLGRSREENGCVGVQQFPARRNEKPPLQSDRFVLTFERSSSLCRHYFGFLPRRKNVETLALKEVICSHTIPVCVEMARLRMGSYFTSLKWAVLGIST